MKPGEIREMRDLGVPDLEAKVKAMSEEFFNLKLRHSLGQLDNPMQLRLARRDLARVKTVLAERLRDDAEASHA